MIIDTDKLRADTRMFYEWKILDNKNHPHTNVTLQDCIMNELRSDYADDMKLIDKLENLAKDMIELKETY